MAISTANFKALVTRSHSELHYGDGVMREHGLLDDPYGPKKTPWMTFVRAHVESVAACDFFTVEAWTPKGLTRYMVLFVIDVTCHRRVQIAGIHSGPHEAWMCPAGQRT